MYCDVNFKTKKVLKAYLDAGKPVHVFQPGPFPGPEDGHITLEGPHYPQTHKWYAQAQIKNGIIIPGSVK